MTTVWMPSQVRTGPEATLRAALLALAMLAGGCTSLAGHIASPGDPPRSEALGQQDMFESRLGVSSHHVAGVAGRLKYRWVPAGSRSFRYEYERSANGMRFELGTDMDTLVPRQSRGTIVFLHGWSMDGTTMLPWALALAERGYDGIVLDLRSHGGSDRAPVGYGPREAHDLAVAIGALASERFPPERPLYLFGVSYGAAAALLAEPRLRGKLAGIVALEPYANAGEGIRDMVASMIGRKGGSWRARLVRGVGRWRYAAPEDIDRAVGEAGQRLGVDLDAIDVAAVAADSRTCILLLHGARDRMIPLAHSRRIAAASPRAGLVELPEENHFSLPLRVDWLAAPVTDWLDALSTDNGGARYDGSHACPQFALPADPARPEADGS
jgi:pimeloyl-ACP methyl ester carboxylesterase